MPAPPWLARMPGYRPVRKAAYALTVDPLRRSAWFRNRRVAAYLKGASSRKLHIGCGGNVLPGWLNTEHGERPPKGGIFLDATKPFPFPDGCFDLIFSEHMIEHVPAAAGAAMLRECHRVLRPGGRVRIATPPLEFLAELLLNPTDEHVRYAEFHYQVLAEEDSVRSPAGIVNDYHRLWGHQFLYDRPTLREALANVGFARIEEFPLNHSAHPELRGVEHDSRMPEGLLALSTICFEAEKPARS